MTGTDMTEITPDERLMAALAHFFGLFGAFIVWITQKDKSRFIQFQSLQALAFGALTSGAMLVGMFLMMLLFLVAGAVLMLTSAHSVNASDGASLPFILIALAPMSFFCVLPLSWIVAVAHWVAAIAVATGHNWRYPIIAPRVEAFMDQPARE